LALQNFFAPLVWWNAAPHAGHFNSAGWAAKYFRSLFLGSFLFSVGINDASNNVCNGDAKALPLFLQEIKLGLREGDRTAGCAHVHPVSTP